MDIKELKVKSDNELESLFKETREKLRHLKFESSAKKLKNVNEISETKKTIARIMTFLSQRRKLVK